MGSGTVTTASPLLQSQLLIMAVCPVELGQINVLYINNDCSRWLFLRLVDACIRQFQPVAEVVKAIKSWGTALNS